MTDSGHHKASSSSISYSVRRMRNTAVLVKWIEDHQSNPYPTKAEKQYLAYYSGMNLTQLSTWFANARRRIKKIGMKTWLEGRSTFSLDTTYFPSTVQARADSYSGEEWMMSYGLTELCKNVHTSAACMHKNCNKKLSSSIIKNHIFFLFIHNRKLVFWLNCNFTIRCSCIQSLSHRFT